MYWLTSVDHSTGVSSLIDRHSVVIYHSIGVGWFTPGNVNVKAMHSGACVKGCSHDIE